MENLNKLDDIELLECAKEIKNIRRSFDSIKNYLFKDFKIEGVIGNNNHLENDTLVLTPAEAAKQIGVSKTVMYNDLLKREDFPSYRLNSKFYISKKGLQEWVDKQINQK
nr:MAG TPA: helix-turn-helix domain protein [Caudoviricetes sp.]